MAAVKELTFGKPLPLILSFAFPLLMGNMLQQTYSLVDAAIVGKFLGINALASVGASSSVIFLILGFCNGCCGGFSIPVAQKFGARDYHVMRGYVMNSLRLSAYMSVTLAIIASLFCATILRMMATPESIFEGAYRYLLITFIGIPCTFFYNLLSGIIRALGDSKTPFWFRYRDSGGSGSFSLLVLWIYETKIRSAEVFRARATVSMASFKKTIGYRSPYGIAVQYHRNR